MRNMVAHNKPICKELYRDILDSCEYLKNKIRVAKENVEGMFIPTEVQIVDALYEEKMLMLEAEAEEIDYQREMSGIGSVWDEDEVIDILANHGQIQELMFNIGFFSNVKRIMEEYNEAYYKLEEIVANLDASETSEFKKKVEEIFETNIEVETGLNEEDTLANIKTEIMNSINEHILNLDDVYDYIDESNYLDYFTISEPLASFNDLENNRYSIYVSGDINPDHNHEEVIEIHFEKNDIVLQKGYIDISYGGFDSYDYFENQAENPIEGDISPRLDEFNDEVDSVIRSIISDIEKKLETLEKIILFIE
jgi:hypothetical protein